MKNKSVFSLNWDRLMDLVGCKTTFCHFGVLPRSSIWSFERLFHFFSLLLLLWSYTVLFAKKNAACKASDIWLEFGLVKGTAAWAEGCGLLFRGSFGYVGPSLLVPGTEMTVPSLCTSPAALCVKLQLSMPQSHHRLPGLEEWNPRLNCPCLPLKVQFCSQTLSWSWSTFCVPKSCGMETVLFAQ